MAFGYRDHEDQAAYGSQPLPQDLLAFDLSRLRSEGAEVCARAAVDHLTRRELDGFFVHLDADVLDDALMPAVDFRVPGGLLWDELATVLRAALESRRATGLEVTIYNPAKDKDHTAGQGLVNVLVHCLGEPQP